MSDDLILFLIAVGCLLVITGLATLLEYGIYWLRDQFTIEQDGDPIEIHAEKPNGL